MGKGKNEMYGFYRVHGFRLPCSILRLPAGRTAGAIKIGIFTRSPICYQTGERVPGKMRAKTKPSIAIHDVVPINHSRLAEKMPLRKNQHLVSEICDCLRGELLSD